MKIKDNSIRIDFTTQLFAGIYQFDLISQIITGKQAIITSGSESTTRHSKTSLHYSGNAVDFRSKMYSDTEKSAIIEQFKKDMTCDFDLVLESTHFHLEHQPKRRD